MLTICVLIAMISWFFRQKNSTDLIKVGCALWLFGGIALAISIWLDVLVGA